MHRPLKVSPQTGDIEAILAVHSPISLAIQLGYLAPKHLSGACEAPSRTRGFALPTRRMPLGRYQDILRADPGGRSPPGFDIVYPETHAGWSLR